MTSDEGDRRRPGSISARTGIVGDDEPVPLLERPWVAELRAEPEAPRALELVLSNLRRSTERVAPIYGVIQTASADPEVGELCERLQDQRLITVRALAAELAAKAGFAPSLPAERAADVLYATTGAELHRLLVVERGWPADDWHAWTSEITAAQLFPAASATDGARVVGEEGCSVEGQWRLGACIADRPARGPAPGGRRARRRRR